MEYYSAIKEVLIHETAAWLNLETQGLFVLNKVNQLHRKILPVSLRLTDSRSAVSRWGEGGGGAVSTGDDETVLEIDRGDACTTL